MLEEADEMDSSFSFFFNWRVCLIVMAGIMVFPLIFVPISTWNETFWRYFNETPIIEWIGQLGWIFLFAALVTMAYVTLQKVFG